MFKKVSVPILGIVENMASYACPKCGNVEEIFGSGGGIHTAKKSSKIWGDSDSELDKMMKSYKEEIFGPVLVMIPYDTEEEAIRIANDTPYGLAGYIQGEDIDRARKLATKIRAGNIHLNGAAGGSDIPFGGFKQSGNGREWGAHGFTDYLEIKAIEGYSAA